MSNFQDTINRSQDETISSEGTTVNPTNINPNEGVNITLNEGVVDTTYKGETGPADNPGVTWDSALYEPTPATSTVSEGGDELGMPSIIKLQ